jgi:hypothetical protein
MTYYFFLGLTLLEQISIAFVTTAFNDNVKYNQIVDLVLVVKYCIFIIILVGLGTNLLDQLKTKYYFEY